MTELIAPLPKLAFFDSSGAPLSGGKLFTYAAGSTSKQATYTDAAGGTPNTNPIILDSRGECDCWITPATAYKFVLSPSTDSDPPTNPIWTVDNIPSGLAGYNITISPNIVVSPTGNPTGGSVPATLSSLNVQAATASAVDREFLLCVGLTSAIGGTTLYADKVAGYFGIVGNNGTHDIWALNSVTQISAGAFVDNSFNSQGYECDFNNFCQDIGNAAAGAGFVAPIAVGLSITGASTHKSTSGLLLSGATNQWNRGISFTNNCVAQASIQDLCNATVSYQMFGSHTTGIDMSGASCTYSTLVANGDGHFSLDSTTGKKAFVQSSLNTMVLGDTGWSAIYSNNTILPALTTTYNIGSGGLQFNNIYCVALTQSSSPTLKTDISPVPSGLASAVVEALPVNLFRWKKGGIDEIETMEPQQVQDTQTVTWQSDETEIDGQGVARLVKRTHSCEQPLFDDYPVMDERGRQVIDHIPARPEIRDQLGRVIQAALPAYDIPRVHREPRMVTRPMPAKKMVDRPGKRLHLGALAPDIRDAFAATGLDIAAFKEDGDFQGYQVDQIVWVTLAALKEEIAARKSLVDRIAILEART